jgi:hypothetical protein
MNLHEQPKQYSNGAELIESMAQDAFFPITEMNDFFRKQKNDGDFDITLIINNIVEMDTLRKVKKILETYSLLMKAPMTTERDKIQVQLRDILAELIGI